MQQIITALKARLASSRKERASVEVAFLGTVIAEAAMVGKNGGNREVTDGEVTAVLKKFLSLNDECRTFLNHITPEALAQLNIEKALLLEFLPVQLTEQELRVIIVDLVDSGRALGDVMKYLKAKYPGQYDGRLANEVFRGVTRGTNVKALLITTLEKL